MVGKRKANSHDSCFGSKKAINLLNKTHTQDDIAEELKALKKLNEELQKENNNNEIMLL